MISEKYISLGKTDIKISPIGLGIMQWGDIKTPNQPDIEIKKDIQEIFRVSLDMGVYFFDTAEIYGNGQSERNLGVCLKEASEKIVVASKFMPFPWRLSKRELRSALNASLKRLGLVNLDLYQIHWPFPPVPIKNWMDAMADAFKEGLIRAVGVSNYSAHQTEIAFDMLSKQGIPLASNQVKYSLLDRHPEKFGLVDLCKKLNITIIAYSPLEKGILTGKYTSENPPAGYRYWRYSKSFLKKIELLLNELNEIGKNHGGMSPAQVSLNWLTSKGVVPIPGAKNMLQAKENAGAMGWQLSSNEVEQLDIISESIL